MPARRLPWFKLWPEAMRHEKIVLLSDGAFRTWISMLAAGSEQPVRWRFASLKHAASVTARPAKQIREVIQARLVDEAEDGELWVHDWRQWQDWYESDIAPRRLREDSANGLSPSLPPDPPLTPVRGETGEERGEKRDTTPPNPPSASGEGERPQRRGRRNGTAHDETEMAADVDLTPVDPKDREVWNLARPGLAALGLSPSNLEQIDQLAPIGRAPDGGLHLRAPPGQNLQRFRNHVVRALLDAGDQAASRVTIVEGRPGESES